MKRVTYRSEDGKTTHTVDDNDFWIFVDIILGLMLIAVIIGLLTS